LPKWSLIAFVGFALINICQLIRGLKIQKAS
jgi:hypothetical protein